jgi:hypothetical protein
LIFTSDARSPFAFRRQWRVRSRVCVLLRKAIYMESNEAEAAEISLAVAMSPARLSDALTLVIVILVFLKSTSMAFECQFLDALLFLVRKRHMLVTSYLEIEDSLYRILQDKNMSNTDTLMYALSRETLTYREDEQQSLTRRYLFAPKRGLPLTSGNRDYAICENEFSFPHHFLEGLLESSFGFFACIRKPE